MELDANVPMLYRSGRLEEAIFDETCLKNNGGWDYRTKSTK